jgi:hypothetical protein
MILYVKVSHPTRPNFTFKIQRVQTEVRKSRKVYWRTVITIVDGPGNWITPNTTFRSNAWKQAIKFYELKGWVINDVVKCK